MDCRFLPLVAYGLSPSAVATASLLACWAVGCGDGGTPTTIQVDTTAMMGAQPSPSAPTANEGGGAATDARPIGPGTAGMAGSAGMGPGINPATDPGPEGPMAGAAAGAPGAPPAMSGTPGADSTNTVPATFETVQLIINETPCFGAGCHNDDQNPLDLRGDDQLHARLTSHISENCGGLPIISPGDPQGSALPKLLRGPCGPTARMPIGCVEDQDANCVPAEYIAAIEQWIALGALP